MGPIFKLLYFPEFLSVFDRIGLKISGFFRTFQIFEKNLDSLSVSHKKMPKRVFVHFLKPENRQSPIKSLGNRQTKIFFEKFKISSIFYCQFEGFGKKSILGDSRAKRNQGVKLAPQF